MPDDFDVEGFYSALNATRLANQMTWKEVAEKSGVAASTLSRMSQGARPDVDGLAALLKWSKLRAEMFIPGIRPEEAAPIAKITALIRADPHLTKKNAKLMEEIVVTTYNKLKEG
jgi:transcriptional regulator with XRE-family HTH domain